jgi:UDP-GlcNAc:undecaprenyl-phosphate/decaprenyl-phosphate GlcNAc-1-phosphate transferase
MLRTGWDAVAAGVVAGVIALALTPLAARLARRVGAIDEPRARGLADKPTPTLGGLAIFAGVAVALTIWLPGNARYHAILGAAALITAVGMLDDIYDLPPAIKLIGQTVAATIPVALVGARVENFTLPFVHRVTLGDAGIPLTVLGLLVVINAVNFSDGVDGLAAGVCGIAGVAFSIIAFDLGEANAGVMSAIVAGAALGFLVHNFPPARVFMGDTGSNLLGLMLGLVAIQGTIKTQALLALLFPLVVLAVPFLDTTFVVLKRLKYRRPVYEADANHFHHRFSRIGFSQRRTVVYLYLWTILLGGYAVALRFVPYSDRHGHLRLDGVLVMAGLTLVVIAASIYLVYVLEILKFRRLEGLRLRRLRPAVTDAEVDESVEHQLETGEFQAVDSEPGP